MISFISTKTWIFAALLLVFSCNSQVKNPKLIKTQGSTEKANVHCSLLDKKGNIWFGTTGEGLYKYDGKSFTQYSVKDGLSSNYINSVLQDGKGNIWLATENGVTVYDGRHFVNMQVSDKHTAVLSMMQDSSGIIWLCASDDVYCYDGKSFTRFLDNKHIVNKDKLHLKSTESIFEDKNGDVWFGSYVSEGISCFNGKSLRRLDPNVTQKQFGFVRVMSILQDRNGSMWFGTGDGAYRYDGRTLTNMAKKEGIDWVYAMLEDNNGNIWFATEEGSGQMNENGGAWRYDGKSFKRFTTKDGLVHNGVFCIAEDLEGNLWFGTRNVSLSKFDGKTFTQFSE